MLVNITISLICIVNVIALIWIRSSIEDEEKIISALVDVYNEELAEIETNIKMQDQKISNLTMKFIDMENQLYNIEIPITDGGK